MRSARPARSVFLALAIAAAALMCGCFDYKERMEIKSDGSGTVTINAWISGDMATKLRSTTATSGETTLPPPVSKGMINKLMEGSAGIKTDTRIEFANDRWTYNIVITFDNVSSLAKTRFFKMRKMEMGFLSGKELMFQESFPSFMDLARDEATLLTSDMYSEGFLAALGTPAFRDALGAGTLAYEASIPGRTGTVTGGVYDIPAPDTVRGKESFKMSDIMAATTPATMKIISQLPVRNFSGFFWILLLGSLIGIAVPAVRLILLKKKGVA